MDNETGLPCIRKPDHDPACNLATDRAQEPVRTYLAENVVAPLEHPDAARRLRLELRDVSLILLFDFYNRRL